MNWHKIFYKALKYWNRFKHRFVLEWSFRINGAALRRHLKRAGVYTGQRRVIVISQVEHLGDIVACEPVVRQVRKQMPESFIVFAICHDYRELVDSHPEIDHVLPVACVSEWARFAGSGMFDQVIDLNIDSRKCKICGVPWHKPDGNRGVTFESYYKVGNLIEAYCKSAGLVAPTDGPKIYLNKNDTTVINRLHLPEHFVVLHASCNEPTRELSVATWKKIISHINNRWMLPVVEVGLEPTVLSANDVANRSLCGRLSILQTAEVIRRCVLFMGIDSGPAHLANAVGAYGIIILGHYQNFRRYMPYSGDYAHGIRCELLHHDGPVAEIPITRIIEAIDRRLSAVMGADLK